MSAAVSGADLQIVAPRQSVAAHLRDLWRYRELFVQLVRKDLKVRYKNSSLGFIWSMLNPLFLLGVYTLMFSILGAAFDDFPIWLLTGLLFWNFFAAALTNGTASITGNAYLVAKVRFPREILPLAAVGAALVHLVLQALVLVVVLVVIWHPVDWTFLWMVIPVAATFIVLASAFAVMLGALNVYARDTGHLLELVLLAWFFTTPILYPYQLVSDKLAENGIFHWAALLNPIADLVIALQRGVYGAAAVHETGTVGSSETILLPDNGILWYLGNVGIVLAVAVGLFVLAIKLFDRAEGNFAEVM